MDAIIKLAELYAGYDLPLEEYRKLPAFQFFESHPEFVETIEGMHIPEVTRLICGSDTIMQLEWAQKYQHIQPLICDPDHVNVLSTLIAYKRPELFTKEILNFADGKILAVFSAHFEEMGKNKDNLIKQCSKFRKELKEIQTTDPTGEKTASLEQKLAELTREREKISNYLRKQKGYSSAIQVCLDQISGIDYDELRENAYALLNSDQISAEEKFIDRLIHGDKLEECDLSVLADPVFTSNVLQLLESTEYANQSISVLLMFYSEGVVDLVEGPASGFIERHPVLLSEYLTTQLADLRSLSEDTEVLLEKAIYMEVNRTQAAQIFGDFWATFTTRKPWESVITRLNEILDDSDFQNALSRMIPRQSSKSGKILLDMILNWDRTDISINPAEIIAKWISIGPPLDQPIVAEVLRTFSQNNKKLQRKVSAAERRLRSESQEIFSALYQPLEQLEELAVKLKTTHGEIKASLAGTQMLAAIVELRTGLESLGLESLAEVDQWKEQAPVIYEPAIHRLTIPTQTQPQKVSLNTLGFRYRDDEGTWQQEPAIVSLWTKSDRKARNGHGDLRQYKNSSKKYQPSPAKVGGIKPNVKRESPPIRKTSKKVK